MLSIRQDDLEDPRVVALLDRHLAIMSSITPPESTHALAVEGLRAPDVTAWTAWRGGRLLGCGALRELDPAHGEIKSMHTVEAARGQGVGTAILGTMLGEARRRGYRRVSLETGSMAAYEPARSLYRRHGFAFCRPFGPYRDDPNSVFMTLELEGPSPAPGAGRDRL